MQDNLTALGQRLAEYRRTAHPQQYNVPMNGIRRTPGLRREEVAEGTGVSAEVVSKIERGKYPSVNTYLLAKLCDFYRLDDAKRADIFHLANLDGREPKTRLETGVPDSIQGILDAMPAFPSFVMNRRWDMIAWNAGLTALFGDFSQASLDDRNVVWIVLGIPQAKQLIVDWERHARRVLGQFRLDYGRALGDPQFTMLTDKLAAVSPEFRDWWSGPLDVQYKQRIFKDICHPVMGHLRLEQVGMRLEENPNLLMGIYYPRDVETRIALERGIATV